LDELGYLTLNAEQSNAFFKLMAERYQAGKPTIITTNLDYPDWYFPVRYQKYVGCPSGPLTASLCDHPHQGTIASKET